MSDKANETVWVMGDADINELRGSICTLETLTELMGKFKGAHPIPSAQLLNLTKLFRCSADYLLGLTDERTSTLLESDSPAIPTI